MNLASRGLRDLDGGPEQVTDALEREAARRQARTVHLQALALTAVGTALVLLV